MHYPQLTVPRSTKKMVDVFRGYNHNVRISDGEFFDMQNMTSDDYPVLSPRGKRGVYAKPASPQGLIAMHDLCYVDGRDFVIGEDRYDMALSTAAEDCPKKLVSMGAYVIILPDKKYINTMDTDDRGSIEAEVETEGTVRFELCNITGDLYTGATVSAVAPDNPGNMALWIDTSSTPHTLKQYAASSDMWVSIATTYVKISAAEIGKNFSQYDGVSISGVTAQTLTSLNGTMVIWEKGDDFIVVIGILDEAVSQDTPLRVERRMPTMDFIIESENRLWGCRYGIALNGEFVNEIYASKLGDFRNWNCFMGISTDSYAASCGSRGAFTGAITLGYPLFWKESCVHKVFGNVPSNFQVQTIECRGVQNGCSESLAIVNETLFYKSRTNICAFDGSVPVEAGYALGREHYRNAVGCAHGNKYYISMQDQAGVWNLFVYDTAKGMWHREDCLHAQTFCSFRGELYCVDAEDRNIITMLGSGDEDEKTVQWSVETGDLGLASPDMKYLGRITIRMMLEIGSEADLYAQYDLNNDWIHLCTIRGTNLRSFAIPIRPRRCDHMKLRINGMGGAKIYSITKSIEEGSDIS